MGNNLACTKFSNFFLYQYLPEETNRPLFSKVVYSARKSHFDRSHHSLSIKGPIWFGCITSLYSLPKPYLPLEIVLELARPEFSISLSRSSARRYERGFELLER